MPADEPSINLSAKVQETREFTEGGTHRRDVLRRFRTQAANGRERHPDRADAPAVIDRRGLHHEAIAALIDAGREQQHAETAGFFHRRAQPVLDGPTVVEYLREERWCGRRVYLQTGLAEHVLRHRDRVSVQMQVPDVLDQQSEELVRLLAGPALPCASFTDGAFHHIATG